MMEKTYRVRRLCVIIIVVAASSAAGCWPAGSRYPKYGNDFVNGTDAMMTDVEIKWRAGGEDFRQRAGILSPGPDSSSFNAFSPDPIPDKVLATWKTADGQRHEQIVEVANRIPDIRHFTGSIVYKFTGNCVVIEPKRE